MVSLNDLWNAAGSPASRNRATGKSFPETQRFLAFQCQKQNVGLSDILPADRGRSGGTSAHWKVAIDYAAYLGPPLKDHVDQLFRERLEEDDDPNSASGGGGRHRAEVPTGRS